MKMFTFLSLNLNCAERLQIRSVADKAGRVVGPELED